MTGARRLVPLAFVAAGACTTALKEPPPISQLAPAGTRASSGKALLEEAEAEYAKRPDASAVRKADGLCLEAAQVDGADAAGLICSIRAKAWLVEHAARGPEKTDIAVSAVQVGQWCLRREPDSAACRYWLAVALGMQAREKPRTADDAIGRIVKLLREASAAAPELDEAGPERILALLYLRAPGWPLGPGDADEALVWAQKAVQLKPDYPPNQLALGEAFERTSHPVGGRGAYQRALELAEEAARGGDPDAPGWVKEAQARLKE